MNIFAISGLVNGIIAITFGVLVVLKNWRDRANQIFFFMTLSLAVWAFSYWQWLLSTNYDAAILWVRILSVGSLFIPVFFYHWVILLINGKTIINKIVLWLAYTTAIIILFFAQSNLFIAGLEKKSFFNFWPNPGSVYDIYFSYVYVGLITYTLYLLLRAYPKELDQNKRGQLLYVILGAALGFGGGLTNFPLWWNVNIPPYGNFLVAAFPFLLGYSVLKYKLFNAKTITAELIAFALWVFTLIITFLAESTLLRLVCGFFSILMGIGGVILVKAVYGTEKLAAELSVTNKQLVIAKEKEIQHSKEVEKLNEQQKSLMHTMNHQIKNFIGKARSIFAELLTSDYGVLPEQAKPLLNEGFEQSTKGVEYVQGILRGASAVTGVLPYDMKPMDARQVAEAVIAQEKPTAEEKGLSFETAVDDGDYNIVGDATQLGEAFKNLIMNAVKYNTPNGSVKVDLRRANGKIIFSVKVKGPPFFRHSFYSDILSDSAGAKQIPLVAS